MVPSNANIVSPFFRMKVKHLVIWAGVGAGLSAIFFALILWSVFSVLDTNHFQKQARLEPSLRPRLADHRLERSLAGAQRPRAQDQKPKPKPGPKVRHEPKQPRSGQPVRITVDFKDLPVPTGNLVLEYQLVDPGKYIALKDAAYAKQWQPIPLSRSNPPQTDGKIFSAELPGSVQTHRRLVRYRIRVSGQEALVAPDPNDPEHNFAYFVYDGVPPWKGAVDPDGTDAKLKIPVTYSSEVLQRVPVYHLISSKASVERATWSESDQYGSPERNAYKYTGTLVYDGVVYDHVGFRARGGAWRHSMGKNMWKFNFLPGHRFEAKDNYGNRYQSKWDKLNLGACIQQGEYGMRGEQGMFEAIGFRLFNLAGVEASRTHWVHFRIINQASESPSDQYGGDFWGLYLAVENLDEHFLKEHGLPAGNLYKIEGGAKTAFNGDPAVTDQKDVREFMNGTFRRQDPAFWSNKVDLARYYNYRSILECIHHYDIDAGKNYFYYLNPESHKWIVLPWDIDLSWGEGMFGGGGEPFYRMGLTTRAPFKQQYQQRLAEIRDLLFNQEQVGMLIDEHAALIWDSKGGPSLADADRAKWDFHPVMTSPRVLSMKAGEGRFYFGNSHNRFDSMIKYMKNYTIRRTKWIDTRLLGDYRPPASPKIAPLTNSDFTAPQLHVQLETPKNAAAFQWRLAEITDPSSPVFTPRQPWKYEIQSIWEQPSTEPEGSTAVPTNLLADGHTYRLRARSQDASGMWSRWSAPVQFTVPKRK